MVCTLLGHVVLDLPPSAADFYADALGAVVSTITDDGAPRINIGDQQIHLAGCEGEPSRPWRGHLEFWTREALTDLERRLKDTAAADSLAHHEGADERLALTCPHGNTLIIRPAPEKHDVRGEPAGGYGALVAISRVVWSVRCGTTAAIRNFWVGVLGSLAEHNTVADGRISYTISHFGSGQQLIFEERRDEDGNDVSLAHDASSKSEQADEAEHGAELDTAQPPPLAPDGGERQRVICYLQSREAFRSAFMAAAKRQVLRSSTDWTDAERDAQFAVVPALDPAGVARLGATVVLRTITHDDHPRGFGRRCGAGRLPGGFGAPARERVPTPKRPSTPTRAAPKAAPARASTPTRAAPKGSAAAAERKRRASGAGLAR